MNYDEFLTARCSYFDDNFGTVVGTVVVTLEDTPLIREIKGRYFVWITESIAISKRKSFAWELTESAADAFRNYKVANTLINFKSFADNEEIIDLWNKSIIYSG